VFDTGHQSYVHKLVTGRQDFSRLRERGGLAGYPQRRESEHDIVESSHASSSLSWADGISRAFVQTGQADRTVVAEQLEVQVRREGALARHVECLDLGEVPAQRLRVHEHPEAGAV
ncbi:1-deoxy-D-xylulose-5-phosphate synthase N-terminal domain-containing protein, partial [Curtobacterium sp. B18]|uniref:1-deoxy-D-xylulose-5-phosphate synthase N-terminal domain-containing protein n=1 Tax=Curtobacterium sp. B18 TaxID=95614 RepID=UPI003F890F11